MTSQPGTVEIPNSRCECFIYSNNVIFEGELMAHPAGFEPATLWFEARCAVQLRHGCFVITSI